MCSLIGFVVMGEKKFSRGVSQKRPKHEGFQYVVERKQQEKVCFGSGQNRTTAFLGKIDHKVGPLTYKPEAYTTNVLLNKVRSSRGVGGLASNASRWERKVIMQVPSPTRYNPDSGFKPQKQSKIPFGSNIKREFPVNIEAPGPGLYNVLAKQCRRTRFQHNFGRPTMTLVTETICTPYIRDKCYKCHKICGNDYWQLNYAQYLCHPCMVEEKQLHEVYDEQTLRRFKKLRNCSFKHKHEGARAAIRLLPWNKVLRREQLECYLDLYLRCF